MRIRHQIAKSIIATLLVCSNCIEPYPPPVTDSDISFLVVDGFINSSEGIATVRLTHAIPLASETPFEPELDATILLMDENGDSFQINSIGDGNYTATGLSITQDKTYKLYIRTAFGREYESDFVSPKSTPPIDSATWSTSETGVTISVNTHDDTGASRYYYWSFEETWEYTSAYESLLKYNNGIITFRTQEENIYYCWKTAPSNQILIGSSYRLDADIIRNFPVTFLAAGSEKASRGYSILIKQSVLSREAFDFWKQLEQTTENIGGLFDPQPGQVLGNVHCLTDPSETVLGYFNIAEVETTRISFRASELPDDLQYYSRPGQCFRDSLTLEQMPIFDSQNYNLVNVIYRNLDIVGYTRTTKYCSDCRQAGGTNVKPDFWE